MSSNPTPHNELALEQRPSIVKEGDPDLTNDTVIGEYLDVVLDPKKEQKLLAKLDMAFVPIIMLTYLSCFLDRTNIGMSIVTGARTRGKREAHAYSLRKCQGCPHAGRYQCLRESVFNRCLHFLRDLCPF